MQMKIIWAIKHMRQFRKIYMWPVWLFALSTQAKSFRDNPVIGSRVLNLFGLHIVRVLLARASSWFRWTLLAPLMPASLRKSFHQDGYVLIDNFLSPIETSAILSEVAAYQGPVRQMTQGDTATQRILLEDKTLITMPKLAAAVGGRKYRNYLAYAGGKWSHSIQYIQRIHNGFREAAADPQKIMHSDTFHPTVKAWLFLEDVSKDKGPFTYIPGSARLTWARLKWEYQRSVNAAKMSDKYSEKGSLRAAPADLEAMGLANPQGITAKAGTLVIANTNGFHGRGAAAAGASRVEIWAYSRHNPFSIWPGLPLDSVANIKHWIMQTNWRRLDARAERQNSRASWHLVEPAAMLAPYSAHIDDAKKKASG